MYPVAFLHPVVDAVVHLVPLLSADGGIEILGHGCHLPVYQLHDERLGIVAVGDLSRFDVHPDAIERLGCSVDQQLFAVGRELCRVGIAFILPDGIGCHGLQVEPVEGTAAKGSLGEVFIGYRKKQVTHVVAHIVERCRLTAKGELLGEPCVKEVTIEVIPITVM